jgi:enterobactin synthetase component D
MGGHSQIEVARDRGARVLITLPPGWYTDHADSLWPWVSLPGGDEVVALPIHSVSVPTPYGRCGVGYSAVFGLDANETTDAVRGSDRVLANVPPTLRTVVPKRLATFVAGRFCAAGALEQARHDRSADVAMERDGAPIWPRGYLGSITHTDRVAGAVVAPSRSALGIGIDCERLISPEREAELAARICPEWATVWGRGDQPFTAAELLTLVFSGKESIYKCLYPLTRTFLEFGDIRVIALDVERGHLRCGLTRDLRHGFRRGLELNVHFAIDQNVVYTGVRLAATDPLDTAPEPIDRRGQ